MTDVPRRGYRGQSAQQRRADRRERLLEAALELFGTVGYAKTSIEKLCAAASVSTRNFYQEFDSREEVLIVLHDRITEQAMTAARRELAVAGTSLEHRIGAALRAYLQVTAADPRWTRIAYREVVGAHPRVDKARAVWRDRLCAFLGGEAAAAADRGEAPRRETRIVTIALIGAVNETMRDWQAGGRPVPLDVVSGELTRMAVAAFTAP